jgi:hypothetical protein
LKTVHYRHVLVHEDNFIWTTLQFFPYHIGCFFSVTSPISL